jgi:CheY-like chemotaxis protein
MSHELRTPLNAIIGFGQLLATADARPISPERTKAFVDHIVNAGRHLLTLINDILNLAQIEAGKLSLSLEPIALAAVLSECRAMTEASAQQRSIRLLFPQQVEAIVHADRTRLKQVLLNLLSNAIKYNRDMGTVVVDCLSVASGRIRISVQDTGIGMRPDQVQSLFQPFNRLGQEAGVQEGTGIGLVVTKLLVELMGGEMGVHSTLGAGSQFWIELRAIAPAAITTPAPTTVEPAAAAHDAKAVVEAPTATVLCVEDNPASLDLIQEAFSSRADLRLLTARNGQVGLDMARTHLPDVILMDNNMPILSGNAAQELLKADPRTAGIPIIAISANAMPSAVADGLAAGFFSYLTKPIELPALLEAVDKALAFAASRKKPH